MSVVRPFMIVDSLWNTKRKRMTPQEEAAYLHWDDEIHADDLLRNSGIVAVTRFRALDDLGTFHIQEYESEAALAKYMSSKRRQELIHETQSHYPAGDGPEFFFEKRSVRCFIPAATKSILK